MRKALTITLLCAIIMGAFAINCFGVTDGTAQHQYYIPFNSIVFRTSDSHEFVIEFPSIYSQGTNMYGGTLYSIDSAIVHQYEQALDNVSDTSTIMGSIYQLIDENIYEIEFYAPYAVITDEILNSVVNFDISIADEQGHILDSELSFILNNMDIEQYMTGEVRNIDITTAQSEYSYSTDYATSYYYSINENLNFTEAYNFAVVNFDTDYALLTDVRYKVRFSPYSEDGQRVTYVDYVLTEPQIDYVENLTQGISNNFVADIDVPLNINDIDFEDFSFIDWISTNMNDLFSIELLPMITLGGILWVVVGLGLLFVVLKVFLGG